MSKLDKPQTSTEEEEERESIHARNNISFNKRARLLHVWDPFQTTRTTSDTSDDDTSASEVEEQSTSTKAKTTPSTKNVNDTEAPVRAKRKRRYFRSLAARQRRYKRKALRKGKQHDSIPSSYYANGI
jgi:hypothetical protein